MTKNTDNIFNIHNSIARKLIIYVVLFSSVVTLFATALQLAIDYAKDKSHLVQAMQSIEEIHRSSVVQNLWVADEELLRINLNEILSQPDLRYVAVRQENKEIASAGQTTLDNVIKHDIPLRYHFRNQEIDLGTLHVEASLDNARQRLFSRIFIILGTQAIKTLIVTSFMLLIFYLLVARHLKTMASYAGALTLDNLEPSLSLQRPAASDHDNEDELDLVVTAINDMRERLIRDIREREKTKITLLENEKRYRDLFDNMSNGVAVYKAIDNGADFIVQDFNKGAEKIENIDRRLVINKKISEAFPGVTEFGLLAVLREVYQTGQPQHFPLKFYTDSRIAGWRENYVYKLPGDEIVAVYDDVTARKQVEEELVHLNAELETRVELRTAELEMINNELKDFAYIVSHDLKAPLRAVSQLAYWLSEDYREAIDEAGREKVDLLINRVQRMDRLIEGILAYSRLGRLQESLEEIDLNDLVNLAIVSVAPPDSVRIEIENHLPVICGDRTRLGQLFQNLIDNAVKFMDKDQGLITIGCTDQENKWRFHIKDNGPGIEPKYHDRIFQIFQTLASRDERESTGIGLTLAKKIVESAGGQIRLESQPGEGSVFSFTLPKKRCDP